MTTPISWRAWAAAAVIFLLGLATGVSGTSLYALRQIRSALQSPPASGGPADRATARIADDLIRSLQLPPPEARRVRAEFAQAATNIRTLRAQSNRQMIAELREGARRAAAELPPDQRAAFHARIERRLQNLGLDGARLRPPESPESPAPRGRNP